MKVKDTDNGLALGDVTAADTLTVTTTGGAVKQSNGKKVTVAGTTAVTAKSAGENPVVYDVTLANNGNELVGQVTAIGKDVSIADTKELALNVTAESVAATVTGSGNGARVTSTQAADLEVKDVSAAAGDVVVETAGKARVTGPVSATGDGRGVAIVSTGAAGGVDITGNVSADKDIVVRADNAAVGLRKGTEAGAVAPVLATPKGAIVLEGKSVSVGEATLKAPTGTYGETPSDNDKGGIGIRATGTADGNGIVLSGSTLVAKNVVLDSEKDITIGKFDGTDAGKKVTMKSADAADAAGSRLVLAAEGDVKGYFDSANRPTESIRIVKSKKISTGESVDLDEFALKTTEDIDEFTFNGSRLALESEGAVHVTVGGDDVTIFNNALYGDKKTTVEASDVSADPAETVKVELGVDPSAAAGGLIGDSIDFKVADGANTSLTVEENATIRSTQDLSLALPGSFTVEAGATVEGAGAVAVSAGGKVVVEGEKTVTENNVERQVAAAAMTGKGVALTTNGTGENADDISIAGSVTTTGGGEAKLTSAKDIALSGAVTSAGKATLKAENGTVRQTAGTLQSAGLEITAKDVQQNGGAITATGETVATATDGSVKLDATAANGAAANDFDSVKASAKNAISITDKDELTVANAAGSADGATATTGDIAITAAGNLTVSGPANAGGNAVLKGASVEVSSVGSVKANGTGNALLKATASDGTVVAKGAVKGASVTLDAPNGVTTSDNGTIEASAGDVYVHAGAGTVQLGANVTATGNAVFKADAGNVEMSEGTVVDAVGVGLQGNGLAEVRASNLGANVRDLALVATAGGATLSGVPADVGNIGISVTGGDLVVTASGDRTFNGATVNAAAVGDDGTAAARAPETGVTAAGLSAAGNNANLDVTITDGTITAGDVTASGNATITATDGAIAAGNVTAGGATVVSAAGEVTAGSIAGDTVDVTAGGQVTTTQGGILGANGTTVNSVGIQSAGNVGQGGDTTIEAGGGAVTAPALASGGLLDVNNAGAVTAAIAAGGDAQIQAASLVAGATAAGGNLTFDEVAGPADVGTLAVGGDMNGTVGGLFTTLGGAAGSVGQQGGFNANGGVLQNGVLNTGAVNVNAANYQMNGDLNAGGAAVNIVAGGGIQGGANAVLRSGQLTLQGGDVGTAANPLQLRSGTIVNLTGQNLYLEEIVDGDRIVNIGTIDANGVLELHAPYLGTAANTGIRSNNGNSSIHSGGDMVLDIGGRVGTMDDPINVSIDNGSLTIGSGNLAEQGPDFIHLRLNGNDYVFLHTLVDNPIGWVIVGNRLVVGNLRQMRLINRALAFTVNTPELKSKQGIFGDPAFVHTKMNASEARSVGNMDMLALNAVDFRKTWTAIQSGASALRKWSPAVFVNQNPLRAKLQAQQAEMETQPDIWVKTPAAPPASSDSGSRSE